MNNLNLEIFKLINGYKNQSHLLSFLAIIIARYLIFLVPIYLTWMFLKKDNYFKEQSLFSFYSALMGLFFNFVISLFYFHPRPFMFHIVRVLISHNPDSSFPSDHVTIFLCIGFYLLTESKLKLYGLLFILLGFTVGLARIYCGIHWPLDIMGSLVVSMLAAILTRYLEKTLSFANKYIISFSKRLKKNLSNILKKKYLILIFLLFIVFVSSTYLFYMEENGNFHVVEKNVLYRSGQLDRDEYIYYIKKYHIKSIINLRGKMPNKNWYKKEIQLSKKMNIIHCDFRLSSDKIVTTKKLMKLINMLKILPKPILIHCKAGADRSGLVSAIWEYYLKRCTPYKAKKQLSLLYLHFPYLGSPSRAMDKSFWLFVNNYSKKIQY